MRRRQFIAGLGSVAAWPLVARAQQAGGRMRRIGVLNPLGADDPVSAGEHDAIRAEPARMTAIRLDSFPLQTQPRGLPHEKRHGITDATAGVHRRTGQRSSVAGSGVGAAGDRVRRIGVLMPGDENDPTRQARLTALTQTLADLGWTDGRNNVWVDVRWGRSDINRIRVLAQELVGLQPEIIVTNATPETVAVQRETRTIPIVFAAVSDRVASGLVSRLDRPGGNVTGFAIYEPSMAGKWLQLLLEIAPGSSGLQSCSIPIRLPHRLIRTHLRRRPVHSRSRQSLLPFMMTKRSKRPSSPLGASRAAALSSCRIHG